MPNLERHTPAQQTQGGHWGHWVRRSIHISMVFVPFLYYAYANRLAYLLNTSPTQLLLVILAITLIFEFLRIWRGWQLFGQRDYEIRQISAFAWGVLAIILVLLFTDKKFAVPIIVACALVDPLLGELRARQWRQWQVVSIGMLAVVVIWWGATLWLGTPWWFALMMAPLTLLAEWPRWSWVDDNALMQLIPLVLVLSFT